MQWQQAVETDFPLCVCWMAFQAYAVPRCVKAHAALSRLFLSLQGNIAGCTHATPLLKALTYRSVRRVAALCEDIGLRVVAGNTSIQWHGTKLSKAKHLVLATRERLRDYGELLLVVQPKKSVYVGSSVATARALAGGFRRLSIPQKPWARNLGHDLFGARVLRIMEGKRTAKGTSRLAKLGKLRKAVGRRITAIVSTGLAPGWSHTAGVSGIANGVLEQQRSAAAAVAGYRP